MKVDNWKSTYKMGPPMLWTTRIFSSMTWLLLRFGSSILPKKLKQKKKKKDWTIVQRFKRKLNIQQLKKKKTIILRGRKELIRLRRKLRINLKMTYPNKRRPRELRRDASHLSSTFFYFSNSWYHAWKGIFERNVRPFIKKETVYFVLE